ncbi:MAG: hypothetical protein KF814_02160 [Nitrospiraceae bacterium]|nr:hypothetical protein [Nitrospiraceae bacterium]
MVEIIGLGTIVTLVWLLAWAMGTEADSERLHGSHGSVSHASNTAVDHDRVRHAA